MALFAMTYHNVKIRFLLAAAAEVLPASTSLPQGQLTESWAHEAARGLKATTAFSGVSGTLGPGQNGKMGHLKQYEAVREVQSRFACATQRGC